ncbi:MAG TPA: SCO family protein [Vicinamibacterales bacterium]|nr:SCO family protein [Vicinamibacterales bacterium]
MQWPALLIAVSLIAGCARHPTHQYALRGQILAVGATHPDGRTEMTIKHEDIPGFMPAMTMPYFVKNHRLLEGIVPGDLMTGTLVLDGSEIYVGAITKTGHAALPPDARPVRIMDVMQPGDEVPDDPLQDQDGRTRKLSDWRGRALAVTFVYTRCPLPAFCPLMDRHFKDLQKRITEDARLRDRVHLASVTFDPAHDTLDVIRAHAASLGANPAIWSVLTGTPAAIDHMTSRFGVSATPEQDAGQTITHNLRTAIVDRRGRLVTIYSGNDWTVDALLDDLRKASDR